MSDMTDELRPATGLEADTPGHRQRGTGWIASKVPLLAAVVVVWVFNTQMGDMPIGSMAEPGPGFWPRVLLIGIILASVLGLLVDLTEGIEAFELPSTLRVLAGFVALGAFVVVFQNTGMILAGFVFLMVWLKGLSGESWRLSFAISVAAPVLTYLLFVQALGVRFPEDLIASLWGGR